MKIKLLQIIANNIINKLEMTIGNDEMFDMYYDLGIMFDTLCITYFDVYLD